eukprot:12096647-Alexandrium_andersonii.AAC.1
MFFAALLAASPGIFDSLERTGRENPPPPDTAHRQNPLTSTTRTRSRTAAHRFTSLKGLVKMSADCASVSVL